MPAGGAARSRRQPGPFAACCKGKCCAWLSFGRKLELAALNAASRRREAIEHGDFSATS